MHPNDLPNRKHTLPPTEPTYAEFVVARAMVLLLQLALLGVLWVIFT